ncbi:phosphoglucomutase/phosphomannomutase family protein [Acaryochloris sp. IP29b_bin.148]|uniref:phosphoglucomutase/phosphomannomutase family protein n=1 Tax=Acaryochloris sp. IP29b_bin.148 TaxID=2969218 RepID=UPI002609D2FB|nr:phosphoglucomutase/phosphomannomutase family protein [Acaryochloris sp. IP29b_bin.148]
MPNDSASSNAHVSISPIKFGTDGWRGIIAKEFTFERLIKVAPVAAEVLEDTYSSPDSQRLIIVGYDRRFLSEEFAQATAEVVQQAGYDVLLANTFAPTPAFSWAAYHRQALGALVITASHNPGIYSGLKVKGAFGGSVPPPVTQAIQDRLATASSTTAPKPGTLDTFDPWPDYCQVLASKVDIDLINRAITQKQLTVFVDTMHGATASGLQRLLTAEITELNSDRDPLFEGGAPEPLPKYLGTLIQTIQTRQQSAEQEAVVGFIFDGDGDRIAAMDGQGTFLSSQILIPILIEHLAARRQMKGEVIKTISGSELIPRVAALHHLPLHETPIGYKYIADHMLETEAVLLGGEESGGIGYGNHIPERDGLLSALYLLEAAAQTKQDLTHLYQQLQAQTGYTSFYDRIDLPLASEADKQKLIAQLQSAPFTQVLDQAVTDVLAIDGYKFLLADHSWLLIRFSGTEPVLRLYCESHQPEQMAQILAWAKEWALR